MKQVESQHHQAGLCAACRYAVVMRSDRGSVFYRCERAATDARFPKYPRLPVSQCDGYQSAGYQSDGSVAANVVDPSS